MTTRRPRGDRPRGALLAWSAGLHRQSGCDAARATSLADLEWDDRPRLPTPEELDEIVAGMTAGDRDDLDPDLVEPAYPEPPSAATEALAPRGIVIERYADDVYRSMPALYGPFEMDSDAYEETVRLPGYVMAFEVAVPNDLGPDPHVVRAMDAEVPGVGFANVVGLFGDRPAAERWVKENGDPPGAMPVRVNRPAGR